MSTLSGFVLGALAAAILTVYCTQELSGSLRDTLDEFAVALPATERPAETRVDRAMLEAAQPLLELTPAVASQAPPDPLAAEPALARDWAHFAAQADTLQPAGEFPWRPCFQRAAASHDIPESLLLAIASGESNFDPAARSDKDAVGLMQIRWPDTSRHLGVQREADLYDPCTNVDAGARYLAELRGRFDNNLHLVVAAYNYGPGRINAGRLPEGARWYSQYIYQHLQRVLGNTTISDYTPPPPAASTQAGYQLLMRFDKPYRARDFIAYLADQVPGLDLQQRSNSLGQHDVVLLYESDPQRLRALDAISESGVATLDPRSNSNLSL